MTYAEVDMGYVSTRDLQLMERNALAITNGFLQLNPKDIFAVVYDAFNPKIDYHKYNPNDPIQEHIAAFPHKSLMGKLLMESAHDMGVKEVIDVPITNVNRPFTLPPIFLPKILKKIKDATASVDILCGYGEEWGSLRKPIVESLMNSGILAHIPGADGVILSGPAINVDYAKAEKEMKKLEAQLMGKKEETFKVTTITGDEHSRQYKLVVECPGDSNVVSARPKRDAKPGTHDRMANVPTLEFFRYAVTKIEGSYAITKANGEIMINLYFDELGKPPYPLVLVFKHGIVKKCYFVDQYHYTPLKKQEISRRGFEFLGRLADYFMLDSNAGTFTEDADGFNEKARVFYKGRSVKTVESEKTKEVRIEGEYWRVSHIATGSNTAAGGPIVSGGHKDMLYTAVERFAEKGDNVIPIISY